MPGHLFEGNPVDEGTTGRSTDAPVHLRKTRRSSKSDTTEQLHLLSCIILVLNGVGDYVPLEASNHRL